MKIKSVIKNRIQVAIIALLSLTSVAHASSESPKQKTLEFKKGAVIEVAYVSVKEGMQGQLQEYFSKVFPLGSEYGFQPLGVFPVMQSNSKGPGLSEQPQMVGFFQWPDVETFLRFHEDPRFLAVVPRRDEALSYLNVGNFYTVESDVELVVYEDRVYEVLAALEGRSNMKSVSKLWKQERDSGKHTSVVLNRYSLSNATLGSVHEACAIGSDHQYAPDTITISEWPSLEASQMNSGAKRRAYKSFMSLVGPYSFPPEN